MDYYNTAQQLKSQIEFYFSPGNLSRDKFLIKVLRENHGTVPISIVATFPRIKEIYWGVFWTKDRFVHTAALAPADSNLLAFSVRESVTVKTDGYSFIPIAATSRPMVVSPYSFGVSYCIAIESVPKGTTVQDIEDAFTTSNVVPTGIEKVPNSPNWILYFESEPDAQEAFSASKKRLLGEHPIAAQLQTLAQPPASQDFPPWNRHESAGNTRPFHPIQRPPLPMNHVPFGPGHAVTAPYYFTKSPTDLPTEVITYPRNNVGVAEPHSPCDQTTINTVECYQPSSQSTVLLCEATDSQTEVNHPVAENSKPAVADVSFRPPVSTAAGQPTTYSAKTTKGMVPTNETKGNLTDSMVPVDQIPIQPSIPSPIPPKINEDEAFSQRSLVKPKKLFKKPKTYYNRKPKTKKWDHTGTGVENEGFGDSGSLYGENIASWKKGKIPFKKGNRFRKNTTESETEVCSIERGIGEVNI